MVKVGIVTKLVKNVITISRLPVLDRPFLESIKNTEERNAYILMDMIKPPVSTNYMVRPGQVQSSVEPPYLMELLKMSRALGHVEC